MAPKEFAILLEDPNGGFYRPGETLRGKVVITLQEKNPYKTLRIILLGRAKTSWYEKEDAEPFKVESVEEYLNFEAEMNIGESKKLERAEYGFDYELSEGLPSSFSSEYGWIEYSVKAILDGKSRKVQEVTRLEFIITGQVDLNDFPEASNPVELNLTQELLFDKGQLGMEVKLSKAGFISGENIHIDSNWMNKSEEKEVSVRLYLKKETTYFAKNKRVTDSKIISSVEGPKLKPQGRELWVGDLIQMPSFPVPFPFLQNCHLIQLRYSLVFEMEIPMPNINLEGTIPLIIGTVPVKGAVPFGQPPMALENYPNPTDSIPKMAEPKKRARGIGMRQKLALTTCLVFRPDRPRLQLPVPKPESWGKPKKAEKNDKPTMVVTDLSNNVEMKPPPEEDLDEYISSLLAVNKISPSALHTPPAVPPTSPATPDMAVMNGKPKWPEGFIRRREVGQTKVVAAESIPPPKPARTKNRPPPPEEVKCPGDSNSGSAQTPSEDTPKKRTLPYPKSDPLNFPLPDFAFNVISVNGQRQPPIGWNVTRNTLTLRRGAELMREIRGEMDGNGCGGTGP